MRAFFDSIRPLFGGKMTAAQVEGCEALIRATAGLSLRHRAYLMATAYHETAHTMQPVRETLAKDDASAIRRLDAAWKAGKLGQVKEPYWREGWFGRGYVQLTHRANYAKATRALGVDFLSDPALAMVPEHAAAILVRGCTEGWFTGKRLSDYAEYRDMRRVVNGTDKADEIARYARAFEGAFVALGDGITDRPITPPQKPATPTVAPSAPADTPEPVTGLWARLLAALAAIFRKGETK